MKTVAWACVLAAAAAWVVVLLVATAPEPHGTLIKRSQALLATLGR